MGNEVHLEYESAVNYIDSNISIEETTAIVAAVDQTITELDAV